MNTVFMHSRPTERAATGASPREEGRGREPEGLGTSNGRTTLQWYPDTWWRSGGAQSLRTVFRLKTKGAAATQPVLRPMGGSVHAGGLSLG